MDVIDNMDVIKCQPHWYPWYSQCSYWQQPRENNLSGEFINRPGVDRAALQTNLWLCQLIRKITQGKKTFL